MVISKKSHNCFEVRELSENSNDFAKLIAGMLSRGVNIHDVKDVGPKKQFCIN